MKNLRWKISLISLGFALAACSAVEEPNVVDRESSDVTLSPERLELSAPIGGSTEGSLSVTNNGNERLYYVGDVAFTPDLEVTSGEQGNLEPGESATVEFRATCAEVRLKEDENGFFIPINISIANSGREYFPFIDTLPLTLRCL